MDIKDFKAYLKREFESDTLGDVPDELLKDLLSHSDAMEGHKFENMGDDLSSKDLIQMYYLNPDRYDLFWGIGLDYLDKVWKPAVFLVDLEHPEPDSSGWSRDYERFVAEPWIANDYVVTEMPDRIKKDLVDRWATDPTWAFIAIGVSGLLAAGTIIGRKS